MLLELAAKHPRCSHGSTTTPTRSLPSDSADALLTAWADRAGYHSRLPVWEPEDAAGGCRITRTADITATGEVLVAAVTSDIGRARSTETIPLPWHPDGHPHTRLRRPSEVVCSWTARVRVAELADTGGFVPDDLLPGVLALVQALN